MYAYCAGEHNDIVRMFIVARPLLGCMRFLGLPISLLAHDPLSQLDYLMITRAKSTVQALGHGAEFSVI